MVLLAVPCIFPMFGLTLLVSLSGYFRVFLMLRMNMNLSLVCGSKMEKMPLSCFRQFAFFRVGDQDFVLRVVQEKFSVF